jgi:hypothetical protein
MSEEATRWASLAVTIAFALLVIVRGVLPALRKRRETAPARSAISKAVSVASDEKRSPSERARSLVEAGRKALDELEKPRLAAHHAEWAHRLSPSDPEVIALAVDALRAARAHGRLERLLWTSLDVAADDEVRRCAIDALAALYEGPMRCPERGRALRRLGPS